MALAHLQMLPECSTSFSNEEACVEHPGRGSTFVYTSTPICIADISLPGINALPRWLLAIVYLLLICYLFLGVSLASDLFVDGIVQITSTKRKVRRKNERGEWVEVEEPVWNWVVANITLMALGTSAPEILLATVEALLTLGKPAGQLGPACIVGSAAYNFLVITAVCTLVVPTGQFKRVSELRVYITTATWSIFAYIWMLVVYSWWTPNQVTITEALLTLLFFVLLVASAYAVDVRFWKRRSVVVPVPQLAADGPLTRDVEEAEGRKPTGERASQDGQRTTSKTLRPLPSYRFRASSRTSTGPKVAYTTTPQLQPAMSGDGEGGGAAPASPAVHMRRQAAASQARDTQAKERLLREPNLARVGFRSSAYGCLASSGAARVTVVRNGGDLSLPLQLQYETQDGDAITGLDYKATRGTINFAPNEKAKPLDIEVLGRHATAPDVWFWVALAPSSGTCCPYAITQERVRVTISDDDDAGVLSFELPAVEAVFRPWQPWAEVVVVRRGGQDGQVQVAFETEDSTAAANRDYVPNSGVLTFETGEKTQTIRVELLPMKLASKLSASASALSPSLSAAANGLSAGPTDPWVMPAPVTASITGAAPGHRAFRLRLLDPSGGATLGNKPITTVTLAAADTDQQKAQELAVAKLQLLGPGRQSISRSGEQRSGDAGKDGGNFNGGGGKGGDNPGGAVLLPSSSLDRSASGGGGEAFDLWAAYKEQFYAAFSVPQPEPGEPRPGVAYHLMHLGSIFFKVVFAVLVPPSEWRGGYPCFLTALAMVVALVYVLEQAANLLGCVTGLSEFMVGISLVAAGTSLPDTYASMMAARTDPNADAAVGNITGSNSVNVFLGLGLPWTICSVYYAVKGESYVAPAGDLGFAVGLFAVFLMIAITIQFVRRYQGGELGGGRAGKTFVSCTFLGLWVLYLLLSGLRSTGKLDL